MEALSSYSCLWRSLLPQYEPREAQAVVRTLLEDRFDLSLTDICSGAVEHLDEHQRSVLSADMDRLQQGEPIQYVTGKAWFAGMYFAVGPGTLIPRPETEVLVDVISSHLQERNSIGLTKDKQSTNLLDIGTGSGCIAVTIAHRHPEVSVTAWDISPAALKYARRNALEHEAKVDFQLQDTLSPPDDRCHWDVIVSNPPYVCESERSSMEHHVLDHEPETALFVPDDDPLRFYRAITRYARQALRPGGLLAFEVNTAFADEVNRLLCSENFQNTMIHNDQYDKPRVVEGLLP
ncbi:MAG: peptide chain release factor N(5)-glutamine methyltransferase [Prevotella sp.]|jgi:release factor glutamine methyltransferase